jgi:hypothetical protein
MAALAGLMLTGLGGCAGGSTGRTATPEPRHCPAPTAPGDSLRSGTVMIDERAVARDVPMRLEQATPESYQIVGPEPPALAALPVARIDLIQFVSGPEAEARYFLCPGTVAMLVTTRS